MEEPEATEGWIRRAKGPSDHGDAVGQVRRERLTMRGHAAASRPGLSHDEQTAGDGSLPSQLPGDPRAQACLAIQRRHRRLQVRDDRLHRDTRSTPLAAGRASTSTEPRSPPNAKVTSVRQVQPAAGRDEPAHDDLDERGMVRIEEAIERFAVEVQSNHDPRPDRGSDGVERPDRKPIAAPDLDPSDGRP